MKSYLVSLAMRARGEQRSLVPIGTPVFPSSPVLDIPEEIEPAPWSGSRRAAARRTSVHPRGETEDPHRATGAVPRRTGPVPSEHSPVRLVTLETTTATERRLPHPIGNDLEVTTSALHSPAQTAAAISASSAVERAIEPTEPKRIESGAVPEPIGDLRRTVSAADQPEPMDMPAATRNQPGTSVELAAQPPRLTPVARRAPHDMPRAAGDPGPGALGEEAVRISIGRIEVHTGGPLSSPQAAPTVSRRPPARLSLDEYLRRRKRSGPA